LMHVRVDFDGDNVARLLREKCRHATGAGTDFKHNIVRAKLCLANDELDDVQIDEKVLAEISARMETMLFKQLHEFRPRLPLSVLHNLESVLRVSIKASLLRRREQTPRKALRGVKLHPSATSSAHTSPEYLSRYSLRRRRFALRASSSPTCAE